MPSYINPYFGPTYYPVSNTGGYIPQYQQMQQMPVQQSYSMGPACAMAWVDGEIEARGRQMPQGVTQLAMWDTNRQVIYLKSLNQMGMPNPMQILHYTIDDQQNILPSGQNGEGGNSGNVNGASNASGPDMSQYVTKRDFDQLRNEIRALSRGSGASYANTNVGGGSNTVSGTGAGTGAVNSNQNGSNNSGSRGGSR